MLFDTTCAPTTQAGKRAHPTIVDKALWMEKLLADKNLNQSAKIIGVRLSLHHNSQTGKCFPPVEVLMDGTNNSRATVHRALTALKKFGYIDWKTGNSKWSNSYVLLQDPAITPSKADTSGRGSHVRLAISDGMPISDVEDATDAPTVSPVRPLTVSPVRPQPLKSYPKGNSERKEERKSEAQTSEVLDGPATPFRPDGHQGAHDSTDAKQPATVITPADERKSFAEIATTEWVAEQISWAQGQFYDDFAFITPASKNFKRIAIEKGWRLQDDKWHDVWMSYSMSEYGKRPSQAPKKGSAAV